MSTSSKPRISQVLLKPKLEYHVSQRHPTSALSSSRFQSHSHACSLHDVSDTHECPIDAKNVVQGMSHQEHGTQGSDDLTPNPAESIHQCSSSMAWPRYDPEDVGWMGHRATARVCRRTLGQSQS